MDKQERVVELSNWEGKGLWGGGWGSKGTGTANGIGVEAKPNRALGSPRKALGLCGEGRSRLWAITSVCSGLREWPVSWSSGGQGHNLCAFGGMEVTGIKGEGDRSSVDPDSY